MDLNGDYIPLLYKKNQLRFGFLSAYLAFKI